MNYQLKERMEEINEILKRIDGINDQLKTLQGLGILEIVRLKRERESLQTQLDELYKNLED